MSTETTDYIEGLVAQFERNQRSNSNGGAADQPQHSDRSQDGASFILDPEESVPSLWGEPDAIAWAAGEPLMICGPQGVGKTTLLQQLALRRSGVVDGNLLDMPVTVGPERVLYIAADRPRQIARSFKRMVDEDQREALARALVIWRGPLPFDLGKARPGQLKEFVAGFGEVDTVFIDSLKDVAINLADSEVGSRVNAEFQELITSGVNLGITHHQRKASGDNKKPKRLDDVFGSAWLTSGIGSVLLLWGDAGDPIVELKHLKQPTTEVGPMKVIIDHVQGSIRIDEATDVIEIARTVLGDGVTAHDAAVRMFGTDSPSRAVVEKARRRLESKVDIGMLERIDDSPVRYRPA